MSDKVRSKLLMLAVVCFMFGMSPLFDANVYSHELFGKNQTQSNASQDIDDKIYQGSSASSAVKFNDLREITEASDLIALVEVGTKKDEYFSNGLVPYTLFNAEVAELISGDVGKKSSIVISMTGIKNKRENQEMRDDPLMDKGEKYLLFLKKTAEGNFIVVGGPAGRLVYDEEADTVTSLKLAQKSSAAAKASKVPNSFLVKDRDFKTLVLEIKAIVNDEARRGREPVRKAVSIT